MDIMVNLLKVFVVIDAGYVFTKSKLEDIKYV